MSELPARIQKTLDLLRSHKIRPLAIVVSERAMIELESLAVNVATRVRLLSLFGYPLVMSKWVTEKEEFRIEIAEVV